MADEPWQRPPANTPLALGPEWARQTGVLHVTSIWTSAHASDTCARAPTNEVKGSSPLPTACDCETVTLRVAPGSPTSELDRFALSLARARADAILTSGRILREEPHLSHAPIGIWAAELFRFREQVLRRSSPPVTLVLTSGAEIDWEHPIFHGGAPVGILTSVEAASSLRRRAPAGTEVHGIPDLGPRRAVEIARDQMGFEVVSVESGPSSTRSLYGEPCLVDELLLACLEAPDLPPRVRGGAFLSRQRIATLLGDPIEASGALRAERGRGSWWIERYRAGHQRNTRGATSQSVAASGIGSGISGA